MLFRSRDDSADQAKRNEAFERSREQLRAAQEKQRQEQQAKTKVDVYHMPLVPVEQPRPASSETAPATTSAPASAPTTAPTPPIDARPPIVSQSNP